MPEIDFTKNSGVIITPIRSRDWVVGGISGIEFVERIADGNWGPYLPTDERQRFRNFDSMACVTFSALNSLETQLNWMIATGKIPVNTIEWLNNNGYFDDNGKLNCSDRFTAKMSGTTINGNNLVNVWDSIRKDGLLPEKDWPAGELFDWNTYYTEIPQELKDKAKKFLDYFDIQYEWIVCAMGNTQNYDSRKAISEHLKQAPLQIASATCSPWNTTDIIASCNNNINHATLIYATESTNYNDFDHYDPFRKKLALDYNLPYVLKGVLNLKQQNVMSEQATKYLADNNKKFVIAIPSGRNAYIKDGVAMEIPGDSRAALASIAYIREHGGGGGVPDALYDEFTKKPF